MRNMKKFLALVLAMLMITSMAVMTTSAADEADYTDAAQHLAALKIMKGNENGDLMMEAGVTRYQTALFFVQALTGKTDAAVWNAEKKSVNFADVVDYGTAIDYAAGLGIVKGRGNGVFGYNDSIIFQDMIVMAVRALGYETADMSYPYGHILAAQKLGLLEDIDLVNYKAQLKRGETAQLIWNMLKTEVAVVDPITDKILYPGETGLTDAITGEPIARENLMTQAGFADGEISGIITEFIEGDEDEETVDTVVIDGELEIAAADLGITADTRKVTYLGRPVTLFVDCAPEDFASEYADEEATVVFADFDEYTAVQNLGAEGNVKFTVNATTEKAYLTLGSDKFDLAKTAVIVYTFGEDGWAYNEDALEEILASYYYTTKNGYNNDDQVGNTYGAFEYLATELEEPEDGIEVVVDLYYTAYNFAQYIERELPSSATGKDEKFVVLGEYSEGYENIDGEVTDFAEYLLGGYAVNTNKVSKSKGELSLNVAVEGESVQSGDFFFGAYNALDNVLTVAKNCGTFETGRMTASSSTKGTVKINGTNMEFGFAGLYEAYAEYDGVEIKAIIDELEAGKDNVKYIAVDGNIVYMTLCVEDTDAATGSFAIVSTDAERMAELLGLSATKYAAKVNEQGLYIEDGYVVVAALNLTSGEWELAKVEAVATDYDMAEGEFATEIDVATLAKYKEITDLSDANEADYAEAVEVINSVFVAVVEEKDGVYTIADVNTVVDEDETLYVDRYESDGGLTFNTIGRTNAIKATSDAEVTAARVTTTEDSVIVVVDKNLVEGEDTDDTEDDVYAYAVQVRTGVQTARKNVEVEDAVFFAADANLIVLATEADVADTWGKGAAIAGDDTYYVAMPEIGIEYGTTEVEDEYTLTIEGLFDLKTLEMADAIVITGAYDDVDEIADAIGVGDVLSMIDDELAVTGMAPEEALAAIYADDDFAVAELFEFTDEETIGLAFSEDDVISPDAPQAAIDATVITLDLTGFDWEDIDVDNLFTLAEYDQDDVDEFGWDTVAVEIQTAGAETETEEDDEYTEFYSYTLDLEDTVVELEAPQTGVVGNFELAMNGVPVVAYDEAADEYVAFQTYIGTAAAYDEDTETVTMYVVKALLPYVAD